MILTSSRNSDLRFWQQWPEVTNLPLHRDYAEIGRRLRMAREKTDFVQEDVALALGTTGPTYSRYEAGKLRITIPDLRLAARFIGVSVGSLLGPNGDVPPAVPMPGVSEVAFIPVVGEVSAGGGFMPPQDYIPIHPPKHSSRSLVAFIVVGDCMSPRIEHGDNVIVDLERGWQNGKVVLARVGDRLMVKRAYREDPHIRLVADADGYEDIVDGNIEVYGPVIKIEKTPE